MFVQFELEGRFYVAFDSKLGGAVRFETQKQAREYAAIQNIYWLVESMEKELATLKTLKSSRLDELTNLIPSHLLPQT